METMYICECKVQMKTMYVCILSILSTLPTSSHSVNHPSPFFSLELNNAPPPNSVLVYVTVWEVQPGSLKWRWFICVQV